jgi:TPR repeat protein
VKLIKRAAELGDAEAQNQHAKAYNYGHIVPKHLEKTRYYAEKGADQGTIVAQFF